MEQNQETEPKSDFESMWLRLLNVIIVAILLSMANTLLGVMTIAQMIVMAVNNREPNENLAEFGTALGMWIAKAARYQTGASEVKPWPWTELD